MCHLFFLRMRKLEKKLEENKIKEEKEAQDLEAMVQHVEQNLQLMTVSGALRFRSDVRKKFSPVRLGRFCRSQKEAVRKEGGSCSYLLEHSEHCVVQHKPYSLQVLCWNHSPHSSSCLVYPQHPVVSIVSVLLQKRAAKAENSAAKLRQENAQLQVQSSVVGAAGIHLGIEPLETILQGFCRL